MAKKSNPKLIGGFVVGAIVLFVIGLLAFGGGEFFKPKTTAVLFFRGSLAGLDVGSPVTFRGVKVGTVTHIVIRYNATTQQLHIPVFIEVDPQKFQIVSGERKPTNIQVMVERGLRAQLAVQSLVTGQVSVNFDFHPEVPIILVGTVPGVLELPTMPSNMEELRATVAGVLAKINKLPLEKISTDVDTVLVNASQLLRNTDARLEPLAKSFTQTSDQANRTLADAQKLLREADANLPQLMTSAQQVLTATNVALNQADKTLQVARNALSPDSALYVQVNATLREVRSAAAAIRTLADYLQRNPNAVLTGKH